jgi:hypothetical protein
LVQNREKSRAEARPLQGKRKLKKARAVTVRGLICFLREETALARSLRIARMAG